MPRMYDRREIQQVWNTPPEPVHEHSKATEAVVTGLLLLAIFAAAYILESPERRAAIGGSLKRLASSDLDGPHRIFAVLAGLWAAYGLLWLDKSQRMHLLMGWPGATFGRLPSSDIARALVFISLPIVVLYVTAFLLAPPIFRWVREGFTKDQDSPNP